MNGIEINELSLNSVMHPKRYKRRRTAVSRPFLLPFPTGPLDLRLMTIKKASQATGASERFLKQLLYDGRLCRYKINSATYISLAEFESIAIRIRSHVSKF